MRWQVKWAVQRACASVPVFSQALYRQIQQRCGPVTHGYNAGEMIGEAARLTRMLAEFDRPVEGATMMEVGTGWRVDIPLGLFLAGAREIYTYDLNRYLREELVLRSLDYIRRETDAVRGVFQSLTSASALEERLRALLACRTLDEVLEAAHIRYMAPADAAAAKELPDRSVDVHFSYTVLEHIPGEVLVRILREAARVLKPDGLALHHVDLSDHFAHVDPSITSVNFLKFADWQWKWLASTPWSYHNRLRVNEYREIYEQAGHDVLDWRPHVDPRSLTALNEQQFPLAEKYRGAPLETLSTVYLDVFSRGR